MDDTLQKKYILTNEKITIGNHTLSRIKAIRQFDRDIFGLVLEGTLGGFVETEDNLSHSGTCWISHNAKVYENARISDNAFVMNHARVYGSAEVSGDACVHGRARIHQNAQIKDKGSVHDAKVYGKAKVYQDATVTGEARIFGSAKICGNSVVTDKAAVFGHAKIDGYAHIGGRAKVYNDAAILEPAEIFDDADIKSFTNAGWTEIRQKHIGIMFQELRLFPELIIRTADQAGCGCFRGMLDEFAQRVDSEHGSNEHGKAYRLAIELAKLLVNLDKDTVKKPKGYYKFESGFKCTLKEYEWGKEIFRKHPHKDDFFSVEDVIRLKRSFDEAEKGKYIKCNLSAKDGGSL